MVAGLSLPSETQWKLNYCRRVTWARRKDPYFSDLTLSLDGGGGSGEFMGSVDACETVCGATLSFTFNVDNTIGPGPSWTVLVG